jgi:hypothetical protein
MEKIRNAQENKEQLCLLPTPPPPKKKKEEEEGIYDTLVF